MRLRPLRLGLGLCVLTAAAGCVEDGKTDEKAKPAAAAKAVAQPEPGEPPKPPPKPPAPAELPADDPLVADALRTREQVARLEEEILGRLDDLRAALAQAKADPARLRQSVELFAEVTRDVRQKTVQAGEAVAALTDKTAELSRSSRHLAASYRALADLYRRKARDYAEPALRDRLLAFAADYEAVAASLPERARALDGVRKTLPALKRKVAEVTSFLGDATAFLATHPGLNSDERDRHATEFESFAVTVSDWLRVLDDLRAALRSKAVSKAIRDAHQREVLAAARLEAARRVEQERAERGLQEALAKAEAARRAKPPVVEIERQVHDREQRVEAPTIRPLPAVASSPAPTPVARWPVVYRYQPVVHYEQVESQRLVYRTVSPCPVQTYPIVREYP